jgi:hypothetical protein
LLSCCGVLWCGVSSAAIINRKVFVRMSNAERCHYDAFIERLVAQSILTLQHHSNTSSSSTGSGSSIPPVIQPNSSPRTGSSSSSGWPSRRRSEGSSGVTSPVLPAHLAAVAYGMAVLGARSEPLAAAVVEASAGLLAQAAQEAAAAPAVLGPTGTSTAQAADSSGAGASSSQASGPVAAASGVGGWGGAEVSSLMWGLGTVGHCPPAAWLQDMQAVSKELMPR